MGAQRRRRHSGAGRGARDLFQSVTRLKQLSGMDAARKAALLARRPLKEGMTQHLTTIQSAGRL